jgi:hypothetical protein
MTDDREELWLSLIRRAYGLPDVLSEEAARAVLAGRIGGVDADHLLEVLIHLGAKGHLDDFLMTGEDAERIGNHFGLPETIEYRLRDAGLAQAGQAAKRAQTVVDEVRQYLDAHSDQVL